MLINFIFLISYLILRKIFYFDKESKKKQNIIQFMIDFGQILAAVLFYCFK